jgi:3-methyladenine DNA glycosylase/8-oxoguanine DNA glycosylase
METTWTPGRPVDVRATLGSLGRGRADPSYQVDRDGAVWWATSTPIGDGTLRLQTGDGHVRALAWGPGAEWLVDGLPTLLGAGDDAALEGFAPHHDQVREAARRARGWRVPRTRRPFDACVVAVLEQKVTGLEARSAWRTLLRRFGRPAPGPAAMAICPAPAVWRDLPDWEYRRIGVTPQRVRTLRTVAAASAAIERTAEADGHTADRVLRSLPGVGIWTSAEVRQRAHGDADAISFGDFHIAKDVCWWLTGTPGGDDRLAELLESYQGHRYRVQRLMELSGIKRPRRQPRLAVPEHRFGLSTR